jgi:hypothetical protein
MKVRLLLFSAAGLVAAVAVGQLRITSLNSSGELTWTNSARVGAYRVEWANLPAGPWNPFATLTNLNSLWAETNCVTAQLPVSNPPAFYRVGWTPPDPAGVWDYRGYDANGVLVVTGLLTLAWATNPATDYYGWHDFKYVGPPTNNYNGWLGPQVGTGGVQGDLDFPWSHLGVGMPTNMYDFYVGLSGTVRPTAYTGQWYYSTLFQINTGPFQAVRR